VFQYRRVDILSWSLIAFITLNVIAASSGAAFQPGAWFKSLDKPSWQPPDWAFPVVWSVLYFLNALAGWWVWQASGLEGLGALAMVIYIVALLSNAGWSALFFGMRRMDLATYDAALLWLLVAAQIVVFYAIVPLAGLILLPYLAWVTIAFWLSRTVWKLNPDAV
jgi:tryptophan-rich sensory protein